MIRLSDDFRVRPLDSLQWVLERRAKAHARRNKRVGERWLPYAYCRSRAGLETALSRLKCEEGIRLDAALIAHLPDFYPGKATPIETIDNSSKAEA
jgi:hypothetical protein